MARTRIEIDEGGAPRTHELTVGLTRVGGSATDVPLKGHSGAGELHVWDDPPKVIHVGPPADAPRVAGRTVEEADLEDGSLIEWAGAKLVFRRDVARPVLEEVPLEPRRGAAPGSAVPAGAGARKSALGGGAELGELRLSRLVRAGLLAEMGLAGAAEVRRQQEAVMRREFSADSATSALLASCTVAGDDPRVLERAERLLRDLLMSPLQTGVRKTGRRMRNAAKGGAAFLISQVVVLGIYTAMILIAMVVVRQKWPDFSFDDFLQRLLPWSSPKR